MNIVERIAEAGIVGCGGAGFPTHRKLLKGADYLIVNGVECEPLLRTDRYVMRHFPEKIVRAATVLSAELGVGSCVIALKKAYTDEAEALRAAIESCHGAVRLHLLDNYYPAGDEQAIVYEVSGRVVPPAGIPPDAGCMVVNAATMLAIGDAIEGRAFTRKYLTVNGCVKEPMILQGPVGISLGECIAAAGGATIDEYAMLLGGPMTGRIVSGREGEALPLNKTTSGLTVLPLEHPLVQDSRRSVEQMVFQARAACVRCRQCTDLCPRHLLGHPLEPHKIMRSFAMYADLERVASESIGKTAALCCECGLCEQIACPMGLKPRRINGAIKSILIRDGVGYPKGAGQGEVHPWRDFRKIPAFRVGIRTGVADWNRTSIDTMKEVYASKVALLLKQSAGSPACPLVSEGDRVKAGELVATYKEGALGSNLHASIDGVVERIDEKQIVIVGKGEV